jgi:hypothetical protein
VVAPIDAFHDEVRRLGVPIIHVRTILRKGGVDDIRGQKAAWRLVFPLYAGEIPNADEHGIEGTRWTEFVTRVEPGDMTVNTKRRVAQQEIEIGRITVLRRRRPRGRSRAPVAPGELW